MFKYKINDRVFYKGKEKIVKNRYCRFGDEYWYTITTPKGQSPLFVREFDLDSYSIGSWAPKVEDIYWFIKDWNIFFKIYKDDEEDKLNLEYGNYFKEKDQADIAMNEVKTLLLELHRS